MFDITAHYNDKTPKYIDFQYLPPREDSHESPVWMGGGRSNYNFYAIKQIDLHLQDAPFSETATTASILSHSETEPITIKKFLQYAPLEGHSELIDLAKDLIITLQSPKIDLDYLVTAGSGDSLSKLLATFVSPGDTILVESYAYATIFGPIQSVGGIMVPYPIIFQEEGPVIDVPALEELLDTWNSGQYKNLNKPKIIYTVPTQNPLGLTQPVDVREKVYALCQKHDLIIFEDDPDGYIRMDGIDTYESYKTLVVGSSYLNLDVDGRVMRMETFSKLFCPGIRLGFIAARPDVIGKLFAYAKCFTKAASGVSQAVFLKTIEHFGGGADAYLKWCYEVSKEYKRRRDAVFGYLKQCESVRKGYITPLEPDGGMFFVVRINFEESDDYQSQLEKFYYSLLKAGVIVVLGRDMSWNDEGKKKANFVRVTNTNLDTIEECRLGAERFDQAALEFFEQDR